jgi:hypothetical protein
MKKPKIKGGQCYENHDIIYEVIKPWKSVNKKSQGDLKFWWIREVITKDQSIVSEQKLLKMRRPFNTEG